MTQLAVVPETQELSFRDVRRALYRVAEKQWRQLDRYAVEGLEYSPFFEYGEPSNVIGYLIADLVGDANIEAVAAAIARNGSSTTNAQALSLAGYSIDTETEALLTRIEAYADDCIPYGEAVRRGMRTPE